MPTALDHTYTSNDEIERVFSAQAIALRVSDLAGNNLNDFLSELIADATLIVDQYCETYYLASDMEDSYWVRVRATWIACYLISMRRGNPAQYVARYEEIIDELARVSLGQLQIPGLATRADLTPAMSNQIVDDRYNVHKLRTHPSISAGGTDGRQVLTWMFTHDWW